MGCLLAGAETVPGAGSRSVLGGSAGSEPQRHALGPDLVCAGGLSPVGGGQRMAGDLLGEDAGLAERHKLYRCRDRSHQSRIRAPAPDRAAISAGSGST
jgi:hypothetical protein